MFRTRVTCRCCRSRRLKRYLDLGNQPLANQYHKEDETLQLFPLRVNVCKVCFHSQLSVTVNPDEMFKDYLYVSGTTDTLREHFVELASDAMDRVRFIDINVLDVACNDGTLLKVFRSNGAKVWGIDPAENLRPLTERVEIPVIVDYFNEKSTVGLPKMDIVTATNVFAHVDDPFNFLKTAKGLLNPDGIIVLEVPYAAKLLTKIEFDTIYHEHLSYFLVNSMATLCSRLGLTIIDIVETKIHGGSLRYIISDTIKTESMKVNQYLLYEESYKLLTKEYYDNFAGKVEKTKSDLLKVKQQYPTLVGYGASAKGNTLLNYAQLPLRYIVDDNPLKWGLLTPGMDIPICSPEELKKDANILPVLVLSWNFLEEIKQRILGVRELYSTRIVEYVPEVRVSVL